MPGPKPKLDKLNTPVTSTFPPAIMTTSAHSATSPSTATTTPVSALPATRDAEPQLINTPISPPLAYTDFLSKAMMMQSPALAAFPVSDENKSQPASTATSNNTIDATPRSVMATEPKGGLDVTPQSAKSTEPGSTSKDEQSPSTLISSSSSTPTLVSSKSSPLLQPPPPPKRSSIKVTITASEKASAVASALASASASPIPSSPYVRVPLSAPPTGVTSFPSLKVPPSPAYSSLESPMSAVSSLRSPFSAMSFRPVFDWDAALKARFADQKCFKPSSSRTSVRHIREVITRTVLYTPRMDPAPRGKRRKID